MMTNTDVFRFIRTFKPQKYGFFFISMLILFCLACNNFVNSPDFNIPPQVKIVPLKKIVRINDSTRLSLKYVRMTDSVSTVYWAANFGEIIGSGKNVIYKAPGNSGSDWLKVRVVDNKNHSYTDSTEIILYRRIVFIKADDLIFDKADILSPRWRRFIDFIKYKNLKAGLGLIGNSLEKGNELYHFILKNLAKSGSFELWNHGYDHVLNNVNTDGQPCSEFWNTPRESQKIHLLKTEYLAREKLNIILHTFGAPGNAIDSNTIGAIEEIGDIKVWFYGLTGSSKMILQRSCITEFPVGYPDFYKFLANYDPEQQYLVLQIHPNLWEETQFDQFKKIIDFLIESDALFLNPYEYYCLIHVEVI